MPVARGQQGQATDNEYRRDGQVDGEQPLPGIAQQDASEQRSQQEGQSPDRAQNPQGLAPLFRWQARADHRGRGGEKAAGAKALDAATGVEHPGRVADHQQQRTQANSAMLSM